MKKMQAIKRIILLSIIILTAICLRSSVKAVSTVVPKVQNVKVTNKEDGSVDITWDKVQSDLDIDYIVSYYKKGETLPNWGYSTENNYMNFSTNLFELGYEYCIQVQASGRGAGCGEYSDVVTVTPIPGKTYNLKRESSTDSTVSVSWNAVNGVKGYMVYLYNSSTKQYDYYGNTTSTNMTITKLNSATVYQIKVRAYAEGDSKTVYGAYSDALSAVTTTKKVTNIKTSVTSSGIKLTWSKSSGATGYRIYRSTSKNGTYNEITTINKNTNTYTDKAVSSGTRYYYKIKSFKIYDNTEYLSIDSDCVTQVYVETPTVSIVSYNDKATIKWKKVYQASGYQIYRATSKNGTYTKIKTITKGSTLSYTDKNIKSKKTYYYKVRAYQTRSGQKYYSAYSRIQEKTKYAQVEITSATYNTGKKSNTLKWKKVSGVTGYKIYRATSKNGTYKLVKTISNNKTTSYTDKKDIGVGNLYYYKIRAYKKSGSKTDYGQYSVSKKRTTGTREQQMNKIKLKPGSTGYTELDKEYQKIIQKVTKGKKTVYDKVKACYKYIEENMKHSDGYNCKHFSGTFVGMMQVLGIQNVYCAEGETTTGSGGWTAHTWVIMEINDTKYIFDPSIDRHIKDSTKKTSYDRFFKTESERSKKYKLYYYNTYYFLTIPGK